MIQMTDFYHTSKEIMIDYQKEVDKYKKLKERIKKDAKRYRTLEETTKNEDYKLAYSIIADYLKELEV